MHTKFSYEIFKGRHQLGDVGVGERVGLILQLILNKWDVRLRNKFNWFIKAISKINTNTNHYQSLESEARLINI
jgi:hypothetical protein